MKVLVIGGKGTIGKEIVHRLQPAHEVITVGRKGAAICADIRSVESIREMYRQAGKIDAVICAAGSAAWKPLEQLTGEDFATSIGYKLMGQVNVIRYGLSSVTDGGSITVTTGLLNRVPQASGAAFALTNGAVEGFARTAALEAPRGIRVNVISPPWIRETLVEMGQDPSGGLPAATVAKAYVAVVEGRDTGQVVELHVQ